MKVFFLTLLYERENEEYYMNLNKIGMQGAVNTFQWNLIKGLDYELGLNNMSLTLMNSFPFGVYPNQCKQLIFRQKKWSHNMISDDLHIGFINLPFIKQMTRKYNIKKELYKILRSTEDEVTILTYDLYLPYLSVLYQLKKKFKNLKVCPVITDLPNEFGFKKNDNFIVAKIRRYIGKKQMKLVKAFDKFVLLTKFMQYPLDIEKKAKIIVEGISNDTNMASWDNAQENIVLYTGTLNKEFGIMNLIEAFKLLDEENFKLIICGDGDSRFEIEKISKVKKNIEYRGYLSKNEISKLYDQAKVLINPRTNIGEYTKYSFPSKTIEYLQTGKPFIGYKLDGIPDEYDKYIYYVKNNTIEELKNTIINICTTPIEQLKYKGIEARNFVINNKNYRMQAKKIVDLILEGYGDGDNENF